MKEISYEKILLWVIFILIAALIIGSLAGGAAISERDKRIADLRAEAEQYKRQLEEIRGIADNASLRLERIIGDVEKSEARIADITRNLDGFEKRITILATRAEQAITLLRAIRETIGQLYSITKQTE